MTKGWAQKKLGEVCVLQRGFDLPKHDRKPGVFPLVSSSGCIDFNDEAKVKGPGVVTGRSGSIGKVFFIEEDFWPLNTTLYVKEFYGNCPRFVTYLLNSFNLNRYTSGAGVPTLNRNHVHDELVFVPKCIDEQKRIVAILDQVFADIEKARATAETNLKNAGELFDSYLQQVFSQRGEGWIETTLGKISDRVSVGHVGPTSEFYCESDIGVPFLRSQNVRPYGIETSKVKFIKKEFHQSLKKSQLMEGDLLFVRVGANRGDCCALRGFDGELNCANIVFARPKGHSIDYLEHFCNSVFGQESLLGMTTGSAQGVINTKSVAELKIPLPPINEQLKIVKKINLVKVEAERLEKIYSEKVHHLDELKKSILQKAFTGELTKSKGIAA